MNRTRPFRTVRRLAGILAALAATLLATATAAPAAFALPARPWAAATGRRRPRCRPSSSAACPAGRSPSSPWPPRSRPPPSRCSWTGPGRPPAPGRARHVNTPGRCQQ